MYELQGGTEDNSLWVERGSHDTISSVWEPTPEERESIANGHNIQLTIYGGQPPVSMSVVNVPLGKRPL